MSPESSSESEPPDSEALPKLSPEVEEAARHIGERMQQQSAELNRALASPAVKQAAESMKHLSDTLAVTPMMKALSDSMKLPDTSMFGLGEIGKSLERLRLSSTLPAARVHIPEFNATLANLPPRPEVVTVSVLHQMHSEFEGMAAVLAESARQETVLVEVTRANLTATQALIVEQQKTRASSDRSSTVQIWLTIALFVVGAVVAVAVAAAFAHQITDWWSWVRSVI